MKKPLLLASLCVFALASPLAAKVPGPTIAAAVADPGRPQSDRDRDAGRKPAQLLALLGVKPGDKVGDYVTGGGYWTRILARAVGPKGKVYAFQPVEFEKFGDYPKMKAELTAAYSNVAVDSRAFPDVVFPEPLDAIITVQNWHDLHVPKFTPATTGPAAARVLFKSLKPGGTLLVVDHQGRNATGPFGDAPTMHRGDMAATRAELTAVGFKLVTTSPIYANAADPRTADIYDKTIQGNTDKFVLKFVKPR